MSRWLLSFGAIVLIAGCGKPPAEAESPADESSESSDPGEGAKAESAADPDENVREAGTIKSDPMAAAQPAGPSDDRVAVLQLAIDDPELDPYLKLGEPGRFPLKISGSSVPSGVELTKSAKPVEVVGAPAKKTDPVLVITSIEISGSSATVGYRYDVEGIRGTAYLKKGARGWELSRSRIVEHYKSQ
ncbi:MAG TPA: hypothetical protein VGK73_29435 [Polyangiaceae bacterium]